jgi:hypothetical protein
MLFAAAKKPISPALVLALTGLLSAAIFYAGFSARYGLAAHGLKPFQSIGTLNRFSAEGAIIYVLAFVGLFCCYWWGYRYAARPYLAKGWRAWALVLGGAALATLALLPLHIVDAADLYDYIIRGRMSAFYGLNPLRDAPSLISTMNDPFYRFVAWREVPSAYGPAWELIAQLASRLLGNGYMANIIGYKLIAVAGQWLTALGLALVLRTLAPARALSGVYLWLCNPLVLYTAAGGGHNDTLMTAGMAFALAFVVRRAYGPATLALLAGALIKFMPALLLPVILVLAWRNLAWRARTLYALQVGVGGLLMVVLCYGPFWFGPETLRAERRSSMYTGSFATVIRQGLAPALDGKSSETWVDATPNTNRLLSLTTLGLLAIFYAVQVWRLWRQPQTEPALRAMAQVMLFYLIIACLWFQSWYALWALVLAVSLDDGPTRRLTQWFSFFVCFQPLLYNYFTLKPGSFAPIPYRDLVPVLAYMGAAVAWLLFYWARWLWGGWATADALKPLAAQLRAARGQQQISDVAEQAGLPTDSLLAYEQGRWPIPADHLARLAALYGLNLRTDSAAVTESSA